MKAARILNRILKDLQQLEKNKPKGISAVLTNDTEPYIVHTNV